MTEDVGHIPGRNCGRKGIAVLCCVLLVVGALCATGCHTRPARRSTKIKRSLLTTGYDKGKKSCGWKRNWYGMPVFASGPNKGKRKRVGITASGTRAKPGTIAADTRRYPFGTVMKIPGYGWGVVEDRGGAIKGDHIDLFFKSRKKALQWGKRNKTVTIWIPRAKK